MSARPALLAFAALAGCAIPTDPATRLAADLESAAAVLGRANGATYELHHATPSKQGDCAGPYKVQLDEAGALVVWCKDELGNTVSSHITTSHNRAVGSVHTYEVEKAAGEALVIELERRGDRAVIAGVR
jgi:hypothetical protein